MNSLEKQGAYQYGETPEIKETTCAASLVYFHTVP